jgi:hypothetical protein
VGGNAVFAVTKVRCGLVRCAKHVGRMENNCFVDLREEAGELTIERPRKIWEGAIKINLRKAYCYNARVRCKRCELDSVEI